MKNLLKRILRPLYNFITNKNIRQLVFLYLKWSGFERYKKVDNLKVLNYTLDMPDVASFLGQFRELFVNNSYRFIANSDEPVILDCGANIGLSCLYFKSLYPNAKITAFEADENIAKIMSVNLQKNNINDVKIINSAVWVHNDGIEFSVDGADGGSIQGSENKNKVNSIRLKEVLESESRKVDLLKIDIEGAEYEVITDCQKFLDNVENIFIEYHSWNNSAQKLSEILDILEKNRFRYFIETVCDRTQPFINKGENQNMDLQLNIYGIKR